MAIVNKPNTFSGNTTISSSEINSNFDTLYNEFNGSISAANLADDAVTAAKLADNAVVEANITDGAVAGTKLGTGVPVQMVSVGYSASATGTTIIPNDDTIPQNTEGNEYMSLAVTPKSATNILVIEVNAFLSSANATQVMTAALFQDSTASALAASASFTDASTFVPKPVSFTYRMVAGTTSATTFKVRAGSHQASTTTFNGVAGNRIFGAIPKSSIVITEYKA